MVLLKERVKEIQQRIRERSMLTRKSYLMDIAEMEASPDSDRRAVSCSNMAHAVAAAGSDRADVLAVGPQVKANIGIISSYNDMLSAHRPFETFPNIIKIAARNVGATAQVAGGVPAMCDGVTQGRPGMELSLMSRDVIAMAAGIGLSHGVYDGAICLGVCDKIVPGLVIGALAFGHLPTVFVPAGPMMSGLSNAKKSAVRKAYARGEVSRSDLLKSEVEAYHSAGTCTFFGTANSNQMLMEIMGLHLPGSSFINPKDDLRLALTIAATERAVEISRCSNDPRPIGKMLDERSFVNAIIGLHATGGSTNHTLHLPAMAAAAGIKLTWQDFSDLSEITPLLARVYPNGDADVNHFHAAGGMGFVISQLLDAGLLDGTAQTVWGKNLFDYTKEPMLSDKKVIWKSGEKKSGDLDILRPTSSPHSVNGGLKMLSGNLGSAVIKVSAVLQHRRQITAPAAIFRSETQVKEAYQAGDLQRDVIVVVIGQGPIANGMPELHSLTPLLSILQDQGHKVALVTDGRMSGASGSVPAAIHVCPEAASGGAIGKIMNGDMITIDAVLGKLSVSANLNTRVGFTQRDFFEKTGFGRKLFFSMRMHANNAEAGGGINNLVYGTE